MAAVRAVEGVTVYAGYKAAEIVSKPLVAAKDAAVSTGETMKEYTARKKEEAQRELEDKRKTCICFYIVNTFTSTLECS